MINPQTFLTIDWGFTDPVEVLFNGVRTMSEEKKMPIARVRNGNVQLAIWENEVKEGKEIRKFNTVTMDRSYKDSKDEWQKSNSFNVEDIPKLISCLEAAYRKIAVTEEDAE